MKRSSSLILIVSVVLVSGCTDETMSTKIRINTPAEDVWNAVAVDLNNWATIRVVEYVSLKKISYEVVETSWPAKY